ncbi:MAG: hypothetical protein OXP66_18645, partial [Candidatus Tectomicrobia bacterium]|nr:hypothetical protein [Candidatus Tectomicrobia bacterium]
MRMKMRAPLTALLLALPLPAWAQVRYEMLTLAEAAYLYSGLAAQEMLRNSGLKKLPTLIVISGVAWLVYRQVTSSRPQPFAGIVAYVVSCTLILALFWPEVARLGTTLVRVPYGGVNSYIAVQNSMPRVNAEQSGLVPPRLRARGRTRVPPAFNLLLRLATTVPMTLGKAINGGLDRPFSRVPVLQEFVEDVETGPPAQLVHDMKQFAPTCFEPAILKLMEADSDRTLDEIVPWSSAMNAGLANIQISLTGTVRNCSDLYQKMENDAVAHLGAQATVGGSNKGQVVEDELDIEVLEQARIYIMAELERSVAAENPESPHRLVNAKRALDALSAAAGTVSGFEILAPLKSAGTQLEKQLDRMARFLGIGSFIVYWGPYVVGIAMFVVLALFPVVVLWSLFPGQHFKPLVNYFLLLIFVCSTPLWWAMVDAAAEVAYAQHPATGTW